MKTKLTSLLVCCLALFCASVNADRTTLIRVKGSDTMVFVAHAWSEEYQRVVRDVAVSVGGGGSGTGFFSMLTGSADLVNASRRIATSEMESAEKLGMKPVEHIVGFDALAVYLHRENPLESISLSQLGEIFGRKGKIRRWSDLGINVPGCKNQEIVRVGRQNSSGTYVYFRSQVLREGRNYDLGILDMLSSRDVVRLIEKTPCAIGYSGLAYATPQVRMACVAKEEGQACVVPNIKSASDKSYPIARPLFVYSKNEPTGKIEAYLDWILSDTGQCVLQRTGYAPIRELECR